MSADLYNRLTARQERLSVIGLGYVGMPIAVKKVLIISTIGSIIAS